MYVRPLILIPLDGYLLFNLVKRKIVVSHCRMREMGRLCLLPLTRDGACRGLEISEEVMVAINGAGRGIGKLIDAGHNFVGLKERVERRTNEMQRIVDHGNSSLRVATSHGILMELTHDGLNTRGGPSLH